MDRGNPRKEVEIGTASPPAQSLSPAWSRRRKEREDERRSPSEACWAFGLLRPARTRVSLRWPSVKMRAPIYLSSTRYDHEIIRIIIVYEKEKKL